MEQGAAVKKANVAFPPGPILVSSQSHLPRISRQSGLSANDKGDNEMIPGAVHIYLRAEEKPDKFT